MADSIGHNFRVLRKLHGKTLEETSHALDWSRSYLVRLETGQKAPSQAQIEAFCKLFSVDPDMVVGRRIEVRLVEEIT